eukprot:CAMPEP_0196588026 /NCGR_PEP_ID=MMETSP1081-20130531/59340_1 /TAXON_ID=36882 /ORGANISM="Pyramimonas amylifera, Strain CCMP720" /LENGTH=384 /DNA_ID=CAMNT_0041910397 /DNA_START=3 /DNA_END=1154 /DNA_ORIENTATION=+
MNEHVLLSLTNSVSHRVSKLFKLTSLNRNKIKADGAKNLGRRNKGTYNKRRGILRVQATQVGSSTATSQLATFLPVEAEDVKGEDARALLQRIVKVPVTSGSAKGKVGGGGVLEVSVVPPPGRAVTSPSANSSRPQVLCLHGFDSSCLEFRKFLPLLEEKKIDGWAVDLLGWGFTELAEGVSYSPASRRQLLYDFWKQYIGTPVILLGGSIGGAIAIDFAAAHPDAVEKLVLVDPQAFASLPPPPSDPPSLPPFLGYLGAAVLKSLPLRWLATWMVFKDKSFANEDSIRIGRLHCLQEGWDRALVDYMQFGGPVVLQKLVEENMSSIKKETLIVWGEQDAILDQSNVEVLKKRLENVKVEYVPSCGHQPYVEQPAALLEILVNW